MIAQLNIENIALIERLELELGEGLNILSGETGAGKSIIIDSLNFVLGERADKGLIRYGAPYAVVEAVFSEYSNKGIESYLGEVGIETEDVLVLRRKLTSEGKNECRINGRVTTLSVLKGLTELLVDIHGQHEHQSLLKVSSHIDLLDSMGGEDICRLKEEYAAHYAKYKALMSEYAGYGDEDERLRRLDILKYQIEEIERADVREGEEEELLDRRKRIRNTEKILGALSDAKSALDGYDSASVTAMLKSASAALNPVTAFDASVTELQDRIEDAKSEIKDVADTIGDLADRLDYDARSADGIDERLDTVRTIQRKYGGSARAASEFLAQAKDEADRLENASDRVAELDRLIKDAEKDTVNAADRLGKARSKTAKLFESRITSELKDLGMGGTTFSVSMRSAERIEDMHENGAEEAEFLISPNVGEPLKPLAKIISGGEMSRFMLALKNIVAAIDGIGTMVFDEIDTGISGRISAVVSEKMCNISRGRQVIAVTHMPSLAAMADSHFLIEKSVQDGKTLTYVRLLADDTAEIARLIGGSDYSEHALPHAKEMKLWAKRYKDALGDKK